MFQPCTWEFATWIEAGPVGPDAHADAVYAARTEQSLYETDPDWGLTTDPPTPYNGIPLQKFLPGFKEHMIVSP